MGTVTIQGLAVNIPAEDEICPQNYLSLIEEVPEPGKHKLGYIGVDSISGSTAGVICVLCGKSWFPKE